MVNRYLLFVGVLVSWLEATPTLHCQLWERHLAAKYKYSDAFFSCDLTTNNK